MHIYFSGISGAALGPLAMIALDCGYDVSGSDLHDSPLLLELRSRGAQIAIGEQTGEHLEQIHSGQPIDWFVYTAALPDDHPDILQATNHHIRLTKRDEFVNHIIKDKDLQMIAVSGTHGKSTTTAMIIWLFHAMNVPVSYMTGSPLNFAPSGKYEKESQYFVYEADEYDRNMLHFHPFRSVIPSLDHDHVDVYPTADVYKEAFRTFSEQSEVTITWQSVADYAGLLDVQAFSDETDLSSITIIGQHNRKNAFLAMQCVHQTLTHIPKQSLLPAINDFPGAGRRMEKLQENLYSDYAHHPKEIAVTLQMASELTDKKPIIVYQPHQNARQESIKALYKDAFLQAEKVYWLPTYEPAGRDQPTTDMRDELISYVSNKEIVQTAEMDDELKRTIKQAASSGDTVIIMGAGNIDDWIRN